MGTSTIAMYLSIGWLQTVKECQSFHSVYATVGCDS